VIATLILAGTNDLVIFDGRPLGNDFMAFWSAARLATSGEASAVYDLVALHDAGRVAVPALEALYVYSYPPVFTVFLLPLGMLAYPWALAVWSGVGLTAYMVPLLCLHRDPLVPWLALAFPAAFINLLQGQTGFFSMALIGGGLLVASRLPMIAGILLGLACFKPHLCLVIPLALLAGRCWQTLWTAGATCVVLILASIAILGWTPWIAVFDHLGTAATLLESGAVPWIKMPSPFAALSLAGTSASVAYGIQAAAAIVGTLIMARLWWRQPGQPLTVAATVCAILLVPPHLNDHDLVLLAIPLGLLVREGIRTGWRAWEPESLLLIGMMPLVLAPLAAVSGIQFGPIILFATLALVLRRVAWGSGDPPRSEACSEARDPKTGNSIPL